MYSQSVFFNYLFLIICYDDSVLEWFESIELHQCIYFSLTCCLVRYVV